MDAFESLVAMLLSHKGYWVRRSLKVELTKPEKKAIGTPSMPRLELDLVAYKGATNELLVVECKSFLDSTGVRFAGFDGSSTAFAKRYKLFNSQAMRNIVFNRLSEQLVATGSYAPSPKVRLALAAGKIRNDADREHLHALFQRNGWALFDEAWLADRLAVAAKTGYENDVAAIVSKLLLRKAKKAAKPKPQPLQTLPFPERREQLPRFRFTLTPPQFDAVIRGYHPQEMEDKWLLRFEGGWLSFYRSWTGFCVFRVRFEWDGVGFSVAEAWASRKADEYSGTDTDEEIKMIQSIVHTRFGDGIVS